MKTPEPIEDRIERIAAKALARSLNLGKCVSESELVAFERRYGVSLPNGYREFVLRIGNGGQGPPDYGLVELAEPPQGEGDYRSHTTDGLLNMKKVFPFTKPWVWEDGLVSDEGTDDQVRNGQIYLGTDGCGMDWALIVTGPDRGAVWWFSGEGIQPTSPKRDFLCWFEDWLDGVRDWWTSPGPEP